jgi:hypothetical protein
MVLCLLLAVLLMLADPGHGRYACNLQSCSTLVTATTSVQQCKAKAATKQLPSAVVCSGDEDRLRQGPVAAAAAAGSASPDQQQQQQQQSPRASRGGSSPSLGVPLPRGPDASLTYGGVKCIEQLLAGLIGEFMVSIEPQDKTAAVTLLWVLWGWWGWGSGRGG